MTRPTMYVESFLKRAGTEGKISREKRCSRHDFEVLKTGANIAENGGEKISQAAITGEFLPL